MLETFNHMIERGVVRCSVVSLTSTKQIVWIDGLLLKLFSELDIKGRMWWLAIKDNCTKSIVCRITVKRN